MNLLEKIYCHPLNRVAENQQPPGSDLLAVDFKYASGCAEIS